MGRVFDELKRRNVIRVAVAYVIASWLVLQVADIVLQGIEAPAWVMKVFMLVLALGLPFVLMFSWAYELTPEGIKKEQDVDRSQSITPETGRKLNLITIGMVVAAVALVGIDRMYMHDAHGPVAASAVSAAPEDKSIAVLAFEDLSPEGDQEYFADGLSEELLNVLAKVGDLKVAGRTSSFAFKGTNTDLREIGELLNVAHILEGSVRKSGDRIRVTAQLIKADDGFHLFSETYDRELDDIFAVQDEIAQKISDALLTEIVGTEIRGVAQTDPMAYELYLMARQRIHKRDPLALQEAKTVLDRVLEIDPGYAPALAQKALATYLLSDSPGAYGGRPVGEALPEAMRLVEEALAVDADLAEGLAVKGLLLSAMNRTREAILVLDRALELNPTMSDTANWLALAHFGLGHFDEVRRLLEGVVEHDPSYAPSFFNLVFDYSRTVDIDRAENLIDRVARIVGANSHVIEGRGFLAVLTGNPGEGLPLLARAYEDAPTVPVVKAWYAWANCAIGDFQVAAEIGMPAQRLYALQSLGEEEAAAALADSIDIGQDYATPAVWWVTRYHLAAGSYQALVDRVNDELGGLDALLGIYSENMLWGTDFLGPLAFAYLQVGDELRFRRLLDEMGDLLATRARYQSDHWFYHLSRAEYAALSGDADGAIEALKVTERRGLFLASYLESPIFDNLRDRPDFMELERDLFAQVDAARAELGMPPYQPVLSTDDRPTFVN